MGGTEPEVPSALEEQHEGRIAPHFGDAERVCSIADALRPGDMVYIGHRKRPIEVQTREIQTQNSFLRSPDYPYRVVWLVGNGTRYRLRYSNRCENSPWIHSMSDLRWRDNETHPYRESKWILKRNATSERVRRIWPAAVESKDELADWVLSRNMALGDGGGELSATEE